MRPPSRSAEAARAAGAAAVVAGVAWLALVPASALQRSGELSYEGYYSVVALPLVALTVAWGLFGISWWPDELRARFGYGLALAGLMLAAAGTMLEFWGGWIAGEQSARAPGASDEAWWGSERGWSLYVFGVMLLFVGGPTAAVALRRALPFWALALIALLGLGILSAVLFDESPLVVALPVFGAFAVGWFGIGRVLLRGRAAASRAGT